jgi:hypothetical protein
MEPGEGTHGRSEAHRLLTGMLALLDEHDQALLSEVDAAGSVELVALLEQVRRRLDGFDARLMRHLEVKRIAGSPNSASHLLTRVALTRPQTAAHRVGLARQLDGPLTATRTALQAGELSWDHAGVIRTIVNKVDRTRGVEVRRHLETQMIGWARWLDPKSLSVYGQSALCRINPPDDPRRQHRRRSLRFDAQDDGMTKVSGWLDPLSMTTVAAAFDPLTAPRPAVNGVKDHRGRGQRTADALLDLCQRAMHSTGGDGATGSAPSVPNVSVTIPWSTLTNQPPDPGGGGTPGGPGPLPGFSLHTNQPLPRTSLLRFTCDASIRRIVLDPNSVPTDVGRATRAISPQLRAAVIARDIICTMPGCDKPATWCDCHHIVEWPNGGDTDLTNLALTCGSDHNRIHTEGWKLRIGPTGRVEYQPPGHPNAPWTTNPLREPLNPYATRDLTLTTPTNDQPRLSRPATRATNHHRHGFVARRGPVWDGQIRSAIAGSRRATNSTIARAMSCGARPSSARTSSRLPWSRKRCSMPKSRSGTSTSLSRSSWASAAPTPPTRPLSSTVTT